VLQFIDKVPLDMCLKDDTVEDLLTIRTIYEGGVVRHRYYLCHDGPNL
jgi:hypothetical protein